MVEGTVEILEVTEDEDDDVLETEDDKVLELLELDLKLELEVFGHNVPVQLDEMDENIWRFARP